MWKKARLMGRLATCSNPLVQAIYRHPLRRPWRPMPAAGEEKAMKTEAPPQPPERGGLFSLLTELGRVLRLSVASSWLVRLSLAATVVLLMLFLWARVLGVLTTQGFGPHGACLLWLPSLLT